MYSDAVDSVSLRQGSDIWHDMQCTTCAKDGQNVEAFKHCVECDSNLCTRCLTQHNKFNAMKSHQLLDGGLKTNNTMLPLPSQRCDLHAGKLMDVFCVDHDVVCCTTCVTLDHRSCRDLKYVPKAATDYDSIPDVTRLEQEADELVNKLTSVKGQINNRLSKSAKDLSDLKKQVQTRRNDIDKHLNDVQRELVNELDKTFKTSSDKDEHVLKDVESTISNINKYTNVNDTCGNESETFVQVKLGRKVVEKGLCLLEKNQTTQPTENAVYLVLDNHIDTMLKQTTQLAFIRQKKNTTPAKFFNVFNVKTDDDEETPHISGICQLTEDEILITDTVNKQIKKLDRNFKVISSLSLPVGPLSVCTIKDRQVAMTMSDSKVQYVLVNKHMVLTSSFRVGVRCRGIAYFDKCLYVNCGGRNPPGHVEIYRENGTHIRSCYEHFGTPISICADPVLKRLFVASNEKGIQVMNKDCELLTWFPSPNMRQYAVCLLDGGRICAASYDVGTVSVFDHDGNLDKIVIEKSSKKVSKPLAIYYDERRRILVISMDNKAVLATFSLL